MGKEAKTVKDRVCKTCSETLLLDAKGLKKHSLLCKRLDKVGLVLPTIQRPKVEIIRP